jgi:hypothetical protein
MCSLQNGDITSFRTGEVASPRRVESRSVFRRMYYRVDRWVTFTSRDEISSVVGHDGPCRYGLMIDGLRCASPILRVLMQGYIAPACTISTSPAAVRGSPATFTRPHSPRRMGEAQRNPSKWWVTLRFTHPTKT